ncbi:MAG: hypothetical protein ACHQJ6_02755 [Candidatus Berkiellales bacterium]
MNKSLTTFDSEMQNPSFRKKHQKNYKKFLLSELIIALMTKNEKSVRVLAKECGISTGVINKLRTGKQEDLKLTNFINISKACGYQLVLEKGKEKIRVSQELVLAEPEIVTLPKSDYKRAIAKQRSVRRVVSKQNVPKRGRWV